MDKVNLINNLGRYTKLEYLKCINDKEFEGLKGFESDLNSLRKEIERDFKKIVDLNEDFTGFGSIADALIYNSIYIDYIPIENDYKRVEFKNDYFKKLIDNYDINFIKCKNFMSKDYNNILSDRIKYQFINNDNLSLTEINEYIKYLLTSKSIDEKLSNLELIISKFKDKLNDLEIDGAFLAKVVTNTPFGSPEYLKLKTLIIFNFTNNKTLEMFNQELVAYKNYKIPF